MSYVNQNASIMQKQSSIGGAIIINGLIIAGLMLTNHAIAPREPTKDPTTFDVPDVKDPPPIEQDPIEKQDTALPPITAPNLPISIPKQDKIAVLSEPNIDKGPIIAIGTTTGIGDIPETIVIPEPIVLPEPIFEGARRDPKYESRFQPIYPGNLLRQEIEGQVTLRFLIGADGRVKLVQILSASHPRFAKATEERALKKWRFLPATRDGKPVEEWQKITVKFNVN